MKKTAKILVAFFLILCLGFAGTLPVSAGQNSASEQQDESILEQEQVPESIYSPAFEVQAGGIYLVNLEADLPVYEKNADQPFSAASLVKMMTCILAAEKVENLDEETVTAETWVFNELFGKNASHADIRNGETLSVRELLYACLLPSANEAALMLADYVSGGYMPNFVYMMNARAKSLGCTGTVFVDPNGLSEENITTARDMYLITKAFMEVPVLREIVAVPIYEMAAHEQHTAPYTIFTTNSLVSPGTSYYGKFSSIAGAVQGGKTGSFGEWQNFCSWAEHKNGRYLCVVLNSPNDADPLGPTLEIEQFRPAIYESALLYEWALSNLEIRAALDTEQPIYEISVKYSTQQSSVKLYPEMDLKTVLPKDADSSAIKKVFTVPEYLAAPVKKGDVAGTVTLMLAGKEIGTTSLLVAQDIQRNNTLYALRKTGEFFGSVYFKILLIVLVLGVLGYIGFAVQTNLKKTKKRNTKKQTRYRR